MAEYIRRRNSHFSAKFETEQESGKGSHTDDLLDGIQKVRAIASLVESAIVWRASLIAWNLGIEKAEPLLTRLLFKEGAQNCQAMDLLARVYFQQKKYEKARALWHRAYELQPGSPTLRRSATLMESISKSPSAALFAYRLGLLVRLCMLVTLLFVGGWGGVKSFDALRRWSEGPVAVQNLGGRFHYEYDSITDNMAYIPDVAVNAEGAHELDFSHKKLSTGKEIGRIEVFVERSGTTLKANGLVPSLYVRYLVEQALWDIPGIEQVDLRELNIDRSYRVSKGDSLWIIARRLFGDGASWTTIARYNDLENPSLLRIGQELTLPLGDETLELNH